MVGNDIVKWSYDIAHAIIKTGIDPTEVRTACEAYVKAKDIVVLERKRGSVMGTNYYLMRKEPCQVHDRYHIAKRSFGWKPCFEGYPYQGAFFRDEEDPRRPAISSIEDIKAAYDTGDYDIVDENDEKLEWDDFKEQVIDWDGGPGVRFEPRSHIHSSTMDYPVWTDDNGAEFGMTPFS